MTLMKIALTLLGTVGLTAGTVLAVSEPTPEPLPKPALTSACSSCKTTAAKCGKTACPASDSCKTKAVSVDSCESKCSDKADCASKVSKKTACPETSSVSTTAGSTKDRSRDKCSKEACSKKDNQAQVSQKKECAEASSCKMKQAKACDADSKVAACSESSCKTQPVSTNACAAKAACEKNACTKEKCTKAVSTKAPCSASKCAKVTFTKAACEASKCPKAVATSTKCDTAKCGPSKSTEAVFTKSDCSGKACGKDACSTKACDAECGKDCEGKCEECPCKAKPECEKSNCEKDDNVVNAASCRPGMTVGAAMNNNSGVVGKVVFTGKVEAGTCKTGSAAREIGECKGHTVYGIDISGLKPSIKRRTVYVANCNRCREAVCDKDDIVATACEAKPACVTNACPVSSYATTDCTSSVCDAFRCERCASDADLARNAEPVATTCSSCDQCSCGTCACGSADEALPGFARVGHVRFEHFNAGMGTILGWSASEFAPGEHHPGYDHHVVPHHDSMVRFMPEHELSGRVHLRSVVPPHLFHGNLHHFPAGPPPEMRRPGMAMSSFGMPVAATHPHPRQSRPEAGAVEGDWSRTVGDYTMTFSCRDGRLHGSCGSSAGGEFLHFSGTFSASQDDQIFGLIDNIEVPELPGEFTSWLVDQPFAVRFRVDGGGLIIKDFRCADLPETIIHDGETHPFADSVRGYVCGRFTPTDAAH